MAENTVVKWIPELNGRLEYNLVMKTANFTTLGIDGLSVITGELRVSKKTPGVIKIVQNLETNEPRMSRKIPGEIKIIPRLETRIHTFKIDLTPNVGDTEVRLFGGGIRYPKLTSQCLTGGKGSGRCKAKTVTMDKFVVYKIGHGFKRYMARGKSRDCPHALVRILSKEDAEIYAKQIGQKEITIWTPKKK